MQNFEIEKTYRTCQLPIIALLMAKGVTYLKIESVGPRRVFFHFPNPDKCRFIERQYFENKIEVLARTYNEKIEEAKDLIFQKKG